jgi:hypothetical protein
VNFSDGGRETEEDKDRRIGIGSMSSNNICTEKMEKLERFASK